MQNLIRFPSSPIAAIWDMACITHKSLKVILLVKDQRELQWNYSFKHLMHATVLIKSRIYVCLCVLHAETLTSTQAL